MTTYVDVTIKGTSGNDLLRYIPQGQQHTNQRFLVGLQGDDTLISVNASDPKVGYFTGGAGEVYALGGSGSDTYIWDGNGVFVIADSGGTNDTFIEEALSPYAGSLMYAFTIDNKHLIYGSDSSYLMHLNFNQPQGKIENYYLFDGYQQHYLSHDDFLSSIKSLTEWRGNVSSSELSSLNLNSSDVQQLFDKLDALETGEYRIASETDVAQIGRLYKAALGREPDINGLNYWVDRWEEQLSLNQIANQFIESMEFSLRYGSPTDEAYVNALYLNVLGRLPDSGGFDYWIERLDLGTSRADILQGFSDSQENRTNTEIIFTGLYEELQGDWVF
jgi:hypothetical protein